MTASRQQHCNTDSLPLVPVQSLQQRGVVCLFSVSGLKALDVRRTTTGRLLVLLIFSFISCWCFCMWMTLQATLMNACYSCRHTLIWPVILLFQPVWHLDGGQKQQQQHWPKFFGQLFLTWKCRSRQMNSCRTEVTNKALDQYLFIMSCYCSSCLNTFFPKKHGWRRRCH